MDIPISPLLDASREEPCPNSKVVMKEEITLDYPCTLRDVTLRFNPRIRDSWCCEVTKQLCKDCCEDLGVCPTYCTVATK